MQVSDFNCEMLSDNDRRGWYTTGSEVEVKFCTPNGEHVAYLVTDGKEYRLLDLMVRASRLDRVGDATIMGTLYMDVFTRMAKFVDVNNLTPTVSGVPRKK